MSDTGLLLPDTARVSWSAPTKTTPAQPHLDYSLFHLGQREAYWSDARITLVLAGTQGGKALAVDTLIPTPQGFRLMVELAVGDEVFDEQGQPTRITYTSPIWDDHDCYRVTFDDGTTVIADAEHRWVTSTSAQRKNLARRQPPNPSWNARPQCRPTADTAVVTTEQIAATLTDRRGAANYSIPVAGAATLPDQAVPIPPYTLGQWLGDGTSASAMLTTADASTLDEIRAEGIAVGPARESNSGLARTYRLGGLALATRNVAGQFDGAGTLNRTLRELNLLGNKHIPPVYFTASVAQRLALVQGLMDADGSIDRRPEFTTVNPVLAEGMRTLLASLGIKSRVRTKIPTIAGKPCRMAYVIAFTTSLPVFRLERKAHKLPTRTRPDTRRRFIVAVDPVPPVPVRCIAVDAPSHQYLCTTSYVPTHNTAVGPPWLLRQIKAHGPGDYLVGAPSFALMEKKVLPEFRKLFADALRLGSYSSSPVRAFRFGDAQNARLHGEGAAPTTVYFGHGDNPETLESMTAKAAWLDEAGQKTFKRESFEAINRRLSIEQGPMLLTTTPYLLGWLSELVEQAEDLGIRVINFPSIANPRFPKAEWDRAQRLLPAWKFATFYRGIFTRPAGLIYDCFTDDNLVEAFTIPETWERTMGLDFGGLNTAAIFVAAERAADGTRTGRFIAYREYLAGQRTAAEHAAVLRSREPRLPRGYGGAKSEGQWRTEFAAAGLPLTAPSVSDVELGIQRLYGLLQARRLLLQRHLRGLRDELLSYSRETDERGEPTDAIADKHSYHRLDALRYAAIGLTDPVGTMGWV